MEKVMQIQYTCTKLLKIKKKHVGKNPSRPTFGYNVKKNKSSSSQQENKTEFETVAALGFSLGGL